jgi:ribosomal protein L7/L12
MDYDERARAQIQMLEKRIEDLERQVFGDVRSPPGPEADAELQQYLAGGDKLRAIKRYVELTGDGLEAAKTAVERMTPGAP